MKKYMAYWALFIIFSAGWYFSLELLDAQKNYYTILTTIAFLAASLVLKILRGSIKQEIHFWLLFLIFIVGYYIKFYVLCYFKINIDSDYLAMMYPLELDRLNRADLHIRYYEMVTTVFAVFSLLIAALVLPVRVTKKKSEEYKFSISNIEIKKSIIKRLLAIAIVSSLTLFYLQLKLGIGLASAVDREVNPLPFRLAGIVMLTINGIIPLLLLISAWLADTIRSSNLIKLTIGTYLLFGVVAGSLSTSKASLISVVLTLLILWLVTDTFTKKRLLLLLLIVPFMGLFNTFLSINRTIRSSNPDVGPFEILLEIVAFLFSTDTVILGYDQPIEYVANYWGLLLRINGADSLMNIIEFSPEFSFLRAWDLLFISSDYIATLYAQDVLGKYYETGVAFSPSLLGSFYFIFGNIALVCCAMILYTLIWHLLFCALRRAKLLIEPIVFSLLIVALGLFTSEGTLEAMPQSIGIIIVFAIFGELLVRWVVKENPSLNSPLYSK